jgi:hypothetical protein
MTTKQQLKAAEAEIRRLSAKIGRLHAKITKEDSIAFTKKHNINWEDIEFSNGKDKPHFGHWENFSNWLNHNACTKKWIEWNGMLHPIEQFRMGVWRPTPANTMYIANRKRKGGVK